MPWSRVREARSRPRGDAAQVLRRASRDPAWRDMYPRRMSVLRLYWKFEDGPDEGRNTAREEWGLP